MQASGMTPSALAKMKSLLANRWFQFISSARLFPKSSPNTEKIVPPLRKIPEAVADSPMAREKSSDRGISSARDVKMINLQQAAQMKSRDTASFGTAPTD